MMEIIARGWECSDGARSTCAYKTEGCIYGGPVKITRCKHTYSAMAFDHVHRTMGLLHSGLQHTFSIS